MSLWLLALPAGLEDSWRVVGSVPSCWWVVAGSGGVAGRGGVEVTSRLCLAKTVDGSRGRRVEIVSVSLMLYLWGKWRLV